MMTDHEIIELFLRTGHLRKTKVNWENYKQYNLTDHEIEIGIGSYQKYFAPEYERFAIEKVKGEPAKIDGIFGPVTRELVEMPRCGCPDFHDPENPLCAESQEANWPGACRNELRFGRSFASLPGLNQQQTDLVFDAACRSITREFKDITLTSVPYGQSTSGVEIFANLKALSGSTLAWSYLARNQCGITLEQAYNTRVNWVVRSGITVAKHELIHAMGGPHVNHRSATMFPSIHSESLGRYGYLHAADLSMMRGIGYTQSGLPQPDDSWFINPSQPEPDPPTDPDQPDPPDSPVITTKGEIEFFMNGKLVKKIVPLDAIKIM